MIKIFCILVLIQFEFSSATEANENQNEAMEMQLKTSLELIYVCPAESETIISKLLKLAKKHYELAYCLFDKHFEAGQGKLCRSELKPIFALRTDEQTSKPRRCGSGRNQFLHYFGYYFCGGKDKLDQLQRIEKSREIKAYISTLKLNHIPTYIYEVCYDISTEKTIWTSHSIENPSFYPNHSLIEQSYHENEISTDSFFMKPKRFLEIKQRYEAARENRRHLEHNLLMSPQPMVPDSHFFTRIWKKTTNHYINMAPLSDSLNTLMTVINDGIKTAALKAFKSKQKLLIYTAVKGLRKPGFWSKIFKYDSFETFEGNIWYKFVYNEASKKGVMIYIHNTLEKWVGKKCTEINEIECNFVSWATSIPSENARAGIDSQHAYCCAITPEEIQKIFSKRFEIQDVFNIDEYIMN